MEKNPISQGQRDYLEPFACPLSLCKSDAKRKDEIWNGRFLLHLRFDRAFVIEIEDFLLVVSQSRFDLERRSWGSEGLRLPVLHLVQFDLLQELAHHHLVRSPHALQMIGTKVGAFFDFGQARFQIAQFLLGLLITFGGQGLAHNITSTTPLGRFLRSVANCRSAQASKSASSAATMI